MISRGYHFGQTEVLSEDRGGSRVRLVCQMTESNFLKKIDTFYEI